MKSNLKSKIVNCKLLLVLLVSGLFTGLIFTNSAYSQNKGDKKPAGKEAMAPKGDEQSGNPMQELKLTPEQKKSIFDLRSNMMKSSLPVKNLIGEKKAHLKTLSTIDNPDMNAINSTIDEIASLKAQIMKMHVANRLEIRTLLTDKQRVIFDSKGHMGMEMEHKDMKHKRMENGKKDGHDGKCKENDKGPHHQMNLHQEDPDEE